MSTNRVTTQAVLATIRKAGFVTGKQIGPKLGWAVQAVDNNDKPALTVNYLVYTPAEAVRLTYNTRGYKHAAAKRDAQMAQVIAALTAKGFVVTNTERNLELLVKAAA